MDRVLTETKDTFFSVFDLTEAKAHVLRRYAAKFWRGWQCSVFKADQ